jgi:hypothetical protein
MMTQFKEWVTLCGTCRNQKPPYLGVLGAGDGTRTHDLLLGKETFYQLNHARMLKLQDYSQEFPIRQPFDIRPYYYENKKPAWMAGLVGSRL